MAKPLREIVPLNELSGETLKSYHNKAERSLKKWDSSNSKLILRNIHQSALRMKRPRGPKSLVYYFGGGANRAETEQRSASEQRDKRWHGLHKSEKRLAAIKTASSTIGGNKKKIPSYGVSKQHFEYGKQGEWNYTKERKIIPIIKNKSGSVAKKQIASPGELAMQAHVRDSIEGTNRIKDVSKRDLYPSHKIGTRPSWLNRAREYTPKYARALKQGASKLRKGYQFQEETELQNEREEVSSFLKDKLSIAGKLKRKEEYHPGGRPRTPIRPGNFGRNKKSIMLRTKLKDILKKHSPEKLEKMGWKMNADLKLLRVSA